MKFLVDAQLPARLAAALTTAGHDATHTSELPDGNRTSDTRIAAIADRDGRIVVTKDRDFRDSHLIGGSPKRLLVVATGNITNTALLTLVEAHLEVLAAAFDDADFIELTPTSLIVHERPTGESAPRGRG